MMLSVQYCAVYMLGHILVHLAVAYVAVYTLCSEKNTHSHFLSYLHG